MKIDPQKIRDHAEMVARSIEECTHEDATQHTDYEVVRAIIEQCKASEESSR